MVAGLAPAFVAAGGSLLGGLIGGHAQRKTQKRNEQLADPANIRAKYEAAGFDPLLGLGVPPVQHGIAPGAMFSEGVANAASLFGQNMQSAASNKIAVQAMEMENKRLEKELQALQLYRGKQSEFEGRRLAVMEKQYADLAKHRNADVLANSDPRPIYSVDSFRGGLGHFDTGPVKPSSFLGDRPLRIEPVGNIAGVVEMDNGWTPGAVKVPGSDGEPWSPGQVAVAAGASAVGWVGHHLDEASERSNPDDEDLGWGVTRKNWWGSLWDSLKESHTPWLVNRSILNPNKGD